MNKRNYNVYRYETEKHNFHQHKSPISIHDVNIDRIVVSDKVPFGKKGFLNISLGTKMILKKIMPLCIMLSKMSAYRRDFDETNYMSFLTKDNKLLENIMSFGIKPAKLLKKDLRVRLYTTINI